LRRHQFETYLDKVFDFSARVEALPEGRQFPQHSGKKIFDAVFLGAACQFPALHRIETECRQGVLGKRIGALSEDTMGYALARYDRDALFALSCALSRQCKRNGLFRSQWARGRIVAAVDGIEICLEAPARPGELDRPVRETNVPMPERTMSRREPARNP
jgi:hypothetical protein